MNRSIAAVLFGCVATMATPGAAVTQQLQLSITAGSPVTFPTVTEAHYDAGVIPASSAALAFSLNLSGAGFFTARTGILSIRGATATMGGTKPIGDLQWMRSDLATWNSLTTTNVTVQSNTMRQFPSQNDPWTNSIVFQTLVSWANDGPATYTPTIVLTGTLTTP